MDISKDDIARLVDATHDIQRALDRLTVRPAPQVVPKKSPWPCVLLVSAILVNFVLAVVVVKLHADVKTMKDIIVIPDKGTNQ